MMGNGIEQKKTGHKKGPGTGKKSGGHLQGGKKSQQKEVQKGPQRTMKKRKVQG